MFGTDAGFFALSSIWKKPYVIVMSFVRARLSFAILQASMLCMRGARARCRTFGPLYGASIDDINLGLGFFFIF